MPHRMMSDMTSAVDISLLELAAENTELRVELAGAQEQLVEMAVDAGELHAEIEALQAELAAVHAGRERGSGTAMPSPVLL